ncbi:MAG: putrescine aminotransferase [Armatimonadetes bacterium]|nr:putrescine aminotransferase [Armatimonadota bacterium]
MKKDLQEIIKQSQEMLNFIAKEELNEKEKEWIIQETLDGFKNYLNPGFLEYRKSLSNNYAAVEWKDQGNNFIDVSGKIYLDFLGGYGIYNMGHRHPKILKAILDQLKKQSLPSQELIDPPRAMLAKLLAQITPGDLQNAFFTNSGTEAVEGALKLARFYTGKKGFIAATRGFHGKSMGALSATAKEKFRKPFLPLVPGFTHVPFGDWKVIEDVFEDAKLIGDDIAAVILEPIQGEGGVNVPPLDYFIKVKEICRRNKALLILDEIQTGMGRTGKIFACEHFKVAPDILCLGKSFGGGMMPIGAFTSTFKIWQKLIPDPFIHSSTFGGNSICCVAAIAAINVMLEENLMQNAALMGDYLLKELKKIVKNFSDLCLEVRGMGLLLGMEFINDEIGFEIAKNLFDRGVLVAGTMINAKVIRLEPPLTITKKEIDIFLTLLEEVFKKIKNQFKVIHQKELSCL